MSEDIQEIIESYNDTLYKRGDGGEILTAEVLRNKLNMTVLRHIYLPIQNKNTEIDIIGVSDKGIFIIENKNWKGNVFCSRSKKYWNVKYYYHFSSRFSPVLQNKFHKEVFEELFDFDCPIYDIIIFNDKTNLIFEDKIENVYSLSGFVDEYKNFESVWGIDTNNISNMLRKYTDYSDEKRIEHISLLRRLV